MLARTALRCSGRLRASPSPACRPAPRPARARAPRHRGYATAAPPPATAASSFPGLLAPFVAELDRIAPSFSLDGSRIRVLQTPAEFYETLKEKIMTAERRIFLSTLYIGKAEDELIATLRKSLEAHPDLQVSILTDALRGTREAPQPSCASKLAGLARDFPEQVAIRMYHTPNLTGLRKSVVPKRINEGWGLQHMKLYGFDDEIILSGANLSSDYFTNRQDRYLVFSSREITEYFWKIQQGVSSVSFLVKPSDAPSGFEHLWPETNTAPSPLENPKRFVARATAVMRPLIFADGDGRRGSRLVEGAKDTRVYPLIQMTQLLAPDTSTELPAITSVLQVLASPRYADSSWTFTAGYFNPAPSLTNLLLSTASRGNVAITASPFANGFYKSKGVSGLLPDAYTLLARRFLREVHRRGRDASTVLKEWRRGTVGEPGGWTYHAKGLWVTMPGDAGPSISLVGSSNYTKRSYSLDLEANAMIVTENEGLRRRLGDEQRRLQDHAERVTRDDLARTERRVSLKVRVAMWIVQLVGGAL